MALHQHIQLSYSNCIAVAATDDTDSLATFSNHGDWVDVAAPGVNIYSELLHDQRRCKSGTSSAAALVSGVAALAFSAVTDTNLDGSLNDKVRQAIENSCSPVNADGVGKGRINAAEAVTWAASSSSGSCWFAESTT